MAAEIAHQAGELLVAAAVDEPAHVTLVAEIVEQALAPHGPALERQGRVELVGAGVDPVAQPFAAGLGKGRLLQAAVLDDDDVPAEIAEHLLEALPQALADDRVERLPVVVDHPPAVLDAVLPALEQRLVDVALVHLRIADQRHHAAGLAVERPAVLAHIVLHQRREERLRDAEPDRAGGEVDVVDILGARRIALRAPEAAKVLESFARLVSGEVLDGVEDRRRMRLDGDAVLRPQRCEVQRGHDGRERRGRRLVAADLHLVAFAQMIGVVDGPGGEPQDVALDLVEDGDAIGRRRLGRCHASVLSWLSVRNLGQAVVAGPCDLQREMRHAWVKPLEMESSVADSAKIDAIDRAILRELQKDGRLSIQDLSDKVGLSPSPCSRRVRLLEERGVLLGYSALIDERLAGFGFSAFVSVKLDKQVDEALKSFEAAVSRFPEVVDCWLMTGNRDYLMRVVTADLAAFEMFITGKLTMVKSVASIESSIPLRRVKDLMSRGI